MSASGHKHAGFVRQRHVQLLHRCIYVLPGAYATFDGSRPTVLMFALSGLRLLDAFDEKLDADAKKRLIDWIYTLQITSHNEVPPESYGFRGSIQSVRDAATGEERISEYESAHIAQTFSALCCLLMLGDDLQRVDRIAVLSAVKACQMRDGSFSAFSNRAENDMRFVFCAVAICYILHDFSFINADAACEYIRNCLNYDGGFGNCPRMESHGGSTYCAVASLSLLGRLWDESVITRPQIERLKRWALNKQDEGFHGRMNKPDDTCYAFWIGGTLSILNARHLVDYRRLRAFLLSTQNPQNGGFSKYADTHSDILHTYFGIAALSVFNEPDFAPIYPALNLPMSAFEHLGRLHRAQS
ncbi:Geranylgeranyl transferase type-1 subunit beta isoform X2 [Aphelenchoides fujianensis]|nr:Geranylgeranyl transferase type-1 subunit beta isoform X2 [Aphelenchoides fujianensis]